LRTLSDLAVIDPHLSDSACLEAAIDIVHKHPERWREFQALALEWGWREAALVCVFDSQARSMRLRWWEQPPCVAGTRGKGGQAATPDGPPRCQPLPPGSIARGRRGRRAARCR
jgi:hypothetical protein